MRSAEIFSLISLGNAGVSPELDSQVAYEEYGRIL